MSFRYVAHIVLGASPWWLFGTLLKPLGPAVAATAALAAGAGINVWQWRRRRLKSFELAAVAYFALFLLITHGLGSSLFLDHGVTLIHAALALAAWGGLLMGRPFTIEYAREGWPAAITETPLFRLTNAIMTGVWGGVFASVAILAALLPSQTALFTPLLLLPATAFTIWFPRWFPRRVLTRKIRRREEGAWPTPPLGDAVRSGEAKHDVIVVGAGVGGLTSAALLAKRGLKVLVVEAHDRPGGFCSSWERRVLKDGKVLRYVFDAGVHDISGLGPRGPVRHLLRQLDLESVLDWRRVTQEIRLPGLRLVVPHDAATFASTLGEMFPHQRQAVSTFLGEMEAVYRDLYGDIEHTGGVPRAPSDPDLMLSWPVRHPHAWRWMHRPFAEFLDTHIGDPQLRAVLSSLTPYLTDRPECLSVDQMAPLFGYCFDGGFYPAGGSQRLADALTALIEANGGTVLLRTAVRRVVVENSRVAGIETADGRRYAAPVVVSNADVKRTFLELVGADHFPAGAAQAVERLEPSASAFVVTLGVEAVPNVSPVTLVRGGELPFGMAVPSLLDPSLAPPGHAAVTLTTLIPAAEAATWDRSAPDYGARKKAFGDRLVAAAETAVPELNGRTLFRQDASPATFARYAYTTYGCIYGPALGQPRLSHKTPVPGLCVVGSGTDPGAGVEAVVISGTLVADALFPAVS